MTSALDITRSVKAPRAVFVNFPLGHQTGRPDDRQLQRSIVLDAMRAFEPSIRPARSCSFHIFGMRMIDYGTEIDYTKGWMPERPSRGAADATEAERVAKYAK